MTQATPVVRMPVTKNEKNESDGHPRKRRW